MPNCSQCDKTLSRHTKGERCLQCYRKRNCSIDIDAINTGELPTEQIEIPPLNSSNIDDIIPLYNGKDIDNRAVINLLKHNMIEERMRDTEFIDILKSQIDFMKDEITNKNKVIDKLINELSFIINNSSNGSNDQQPINSSIYTEVDKVDESLSIISINPLSNTTLGTNGINNNYDKQITNYRYNRNKDFYENKIRSDTPQFSKSPLLYAGNHQPSWEMHSKGFASKMFRKMGFSGKGLGKTGEGITDPITIERKNRFNSTDKEKNETFLENGKNIVKDVHIWRKGTTLITGSSIISGIQENRLKKFKAKVRSFPGAKISDMYHYLTPLLEKKPSNIIIQIGSNDAAYKKSNGIANEIEALKLHITDTLPGVKVFLSCPVIRIDDRNANNTLREFDIYLKRNITDIIVNDNIDVSCLGRRGLPLNPKGSGRLAINYISLMRRL